MKEDFQVQISVHPSEIKNISTYIRNIQELQNIIRRIDIMYVGEESFKLYKEILKILKDKDKLLLQIKQWNSMVNEKDDDFKNQHFIDIHKIKVQPPLIDLLHNFSSSSLKSSNVNPYLSMNLQWDLTLSLEIPKTTVLCC